METSYASIARLKVNNAPLYYIGECYACLFTGVNNEASQRCYGSIWIGFDSLFASASLFFFSDLLDEDFKFDFRAKAIATHWGYILPGGEYTCETNNLISPAIAKGNHYILDWSHQFTLLELGSSNAT